MGDPEQKQSSEYDGRGVSKSREKHLLLKSTTSPESMRVGAQPLRHRLRRAGTAEPKPGKYLPLIVP